MINMSSGKINDLIPMALRNAITGFIALVKILPEEERLKGRQVNW